MPDSDGYPTEQELMRLETWDTKTKQDRIDCLRYAASLWHWPDMAYEVGGTDDVYGDCTYFRFATGGWSGNESIMASLSANSMLWIFCWHMSKRGGLTVFRVKNKEVSE